MKCNKCLKQKQSEEFHRDPKGKPDENGVLKATTCRECKNRQRRESRNLPRKNVKVLQKIKPEKQILAGFRDFNIFCKRGEKVQFVSRDPFVRVEGDSIEEVVKLATQSIM